MNKRPTDYCFVRVREHLHATKGPRVPFWVWRYRDSKEPQTLREGWQTPVRWFPDELEVVTHPANHDGIMQMIKESDENP